MPKMKTHRGAAKRFRVTRTGKVLHRKATGLSAEQARVLERYHATFRRAGAGLDAAKKLRLKEIAERSGLTPASVRVNLHRGMKLLREKLGWHANE